MSEAVAEESSIVLFDVSDRVATITLNRPEVLNAFSAPMGQELSAALRRCDQEEEIRAVVITGAGRAFCSGADFSQGAKVFDAPTDRGSFKSDPFDFHPWDVRKPVIAAINGHAVGLGFTMTLQCDIRLIAKDAKCGVVQARRGVMPDLRSHWTLPRTVGFAKAAELLLTGKMFSGQDAADWGLASQALPAEEVLPAAQEIAKDIAVNTAPVSVGLIKRLLWSDPALTGEEANYLEQQLHLHVMGAPDAKEGPTAWAERREPQWQMTITDDWPDWPVASNGKSTEGE